MELKLALLAILFVILQFHELTNNQIDFPLNRSSVLYFFTTRKWFSTSLETLIKSRLNRSINRIPIKSCNPILFSFTVKRPCSHLLRIESQ